MKFSANGAAFLNTLEGFRLHAYQDTKGIWTIGRGTTMYGPGAPVHKGDTITVDMAERLFSRDVVSFEICVNDTMEAHVLTQKQFDALLCIAYNIGCNAFKTSTFVSRIKSYDTEARIREAWGWYNKETINGQLIVNNGLTNRRKKEMDYFFSK